MELVSRFFGNLTDRLGGPMSFRLLLQPAVAVAFAIQDGLKDAQRARPAYLWTIVSNPDSRRELLQEGWKSVAKVYTMAVIIDAIYQWKVLHFFYPLEALMTATMLALVPYCMLRGPINRLALKFRKNDTLRT
jgi:hypothetical protein